MRGLLVPGFCPMIKIASACAKSVSSTVPLPIPMLSGRPTLVGSWHMFEQSGKLFVPKRAREKLVHERRLVRGASRGIEFGLVRVVEGIELAADQRECLVPTDRHIMVDRRVEPHRLGQTPLLFQPVVTFLFQLDGPYGPRRTRALRGV